MIRMTGELEPRGSWTATGCSVAKAAQLLRSRSTLVLLREAFYGATRFDEFVARSGLSEPLTASRLRELVAAGLLRRQAYQEPGSRSRQGYALTAMGVDFMPAFVALMQWGDRWLQQDGGPLELSHDGCGAPVATRLVCEQGHEVGELAAARRRPPG